MKYLKRLVIFCGLVLFINPAWAKNDKDKSADNLPPGLQKKVDRGEQLPPGWQKKVNVGQTLEPEIYEHRRVIVPLDDNGLITVKIGGKLIRVIDATREVVAVLE